MFRNVVLMLLILSCAACGARQPQINTDGSYQSNEHAFILQPPTGWSISLNRPDIPKSITPDNKRYTERAFLAHRNLKSVIMIESKRLTWSRKPIHPLDIFFGPGNMDRFMKVCKLSHDRLQQQATDAFGENVIYLYTCTQPTNAVLCQMPEICLESHSQTRIFLADGEYTVDETSYIAGSKFEFGIDKQWDNVGWRFAVVWYGPAEEREAIQPVLQYVRTAFRVL